VNSVWFKLYIYHVTGSGPPSLLLVKGTRLRRLPRVFYASVSHYVALRDVFESADNHNIVEFVKDPCVYHQLYYLLFRFYCSYIALTSYRPCCRWRSCTFCPSATLSSSTYTCSCTLLTCTAVLPHLITSFGNRSSPSSSLNVKDAD